MGLSVAAVEEAQLEGVLTAHALGTEECTKMLLLNHLECAAVRTCKAECVSSHVCRISMAREEEAAHRSLDLT